jgi:formylglycine-generating enzyme required for sulfatase activity
LRDDLESGNKGALGSDLAPSSSDVEKLAAQARTLDDVRTKSPPSGVLTWEQAREELAKIPGFDGVVLGKQDDLLPIGRNPDSGLLEFWHVLSGSLPKRDAKRRIVRSDGDGLVFVLLPGGEFRMGAQRERSSDRGGIDFDPEAEVNEANKGGEPVKVALDPYFIATTEISFAQWQRFFRRVAPAHFALGSSWVFAKGSPPEVITGSHPVEGVTWDEANALLLRYGLSLPTEAQWEYAGRAIPALPNKRGPDPDGVPWWFGDRGAIEKLANFGNILDHRRGALFMTPSAEDQKVEDAFTLTAPVGSFAPNPVGLFDVIGNVSEWCLDARVDRYDEPPRAADGLRGHGDRGVEDQHPYRGGDYRSTSHFARLTSRRFGRHDESLDNVGVRPVRLLPR